jgi:hypothetical protein
MAIAGDDATMQLGAALMTVDHRVPEHDAHLRKVLGSDLTQRSPEARKLLQWIAQINGSSIEELRNRLGLANARTGG